MPRGCDYKDHSQTAGEKAKSTNFIENTLATTRKIECTLSFDSAIPFLRLSPKSNTSKIINRHTYKAMDCSTVSKTKNVEIRLPFN
jgi:hypothetical protein